MEQSGAVEAYVLTKCAHDMVAERCLEQNNIKSLTKVVALNTDSPEEEVVTQFWYHIGVDSQKSVHRT